MVANTAHKIAGKDCPNCHTLNQVGILFCEFCAKPLEDQTQTKPTRPPALDQMIQSQLDGKEELQAEKALVLHVIQNNTTLIVQPQERAIIGRKAYTGRTPHNIDVDLGPFDGFGKGVSQIHAVIKREGESVFLVDMGSKNGTMINGAELTPHKPHQIRHGEIAYFGTMPVRFTFT